MKKTALFLVAAIAGAAALTPACGPIDDEPTTGDGDLGGDSGDGDGDGDGTGGTGGEEGRTDCSEEVTTPGMGGAGAAMCEEPPLPEGDIDISGTYTDQFDATVSFTNEGMEQYGTLYFFTQINNDEKYAIALNSSDDAFNPCQWSKIEWYEEGDQLYYCWTVFDADSECDALDAASADSTDLVEGCAGNEWSTLTAAD